MREMPCAGPSAFSAASGPSREKSSNTAARMPATIATWCTSRSRCASCNAATGSRKPGLPSRCSIRVNASVASGANFRGLFWRGAMCVPGARMWRFATARLCSSASVPSAVARSSAPRCSIHSGVSGATSASRPAPRANAAASSRSSCDSFAERRATRFAPELSPAGGAGERGAGAVDLAAAAGGGRRVSAATGACRGAVAGGIEAAPGATGAPVRTTCRLVCQDTTALVAAASGAGATAGSGESAASGSGAPVQIEPAIQTRALHNRRRFGLDGELEPADAQAVACEQGLFAARVELHVVHPQR